jgi:hypothetical protein
LRTEWWWRNAAPPPPPFSAAMAGMPSWRVLCRLGWERMLLRPTVCTNACVHMCTRVCVLCGRVVVPLSACCRGWWRPCSPCLHPVQSAQLLPEFEQDWSPGAVRCLPHAIVVGQAKAGTTALYGHFLLRPDFEPPRRKEVGPTRAQLYWSSIPPPPPSTLCASVRAPHHSWEHLRATQVMRMAASLHGPRATSRTPCPVLHTCVCCMVRRACAVSQIHYFNILHALDPQPPEGYLAMFPAHTRGKVLLAHPCC